MQAWEIVIAAVVVAVVVLIIWGIATFADDALLLLLWIPPIVVVGGAFLYLTGERELFTPLGTALYLLSVLLCIPILVWFYHEIFDD